MLSRVHELDSGIIICARSFKDMYCKEIAENLPEGWNPLLPKDLITEGRLMHNCIGSYCEQVVKNECGLYSGTINQHRYNAELFFDEEVNKLFINQLYGYCNSEPIKEDVKDFIDYVENFNKNIL